MPSIVPTTEEEGCQYLETYNPPFLPFLIIAFPIMPFFWRYTVKITPDQLSFGYSYPKKHIALSSIKEATSLPHVNGLMQWGGWGIRLRYGKNGWETGYITKNGGAVHVTLKDEKNTGKDAVYIFSCDEPKKVCDILNAKSS
jgi:hypothetical protein